jgi:hypothetical protein
MFAVLAIFWLSHVLHTIYRIYPYDRQGGLGARSWYSLQAVALFVSGIIVFVAACVIMLIDDYLPEWPALIEALVTGVFLAGASTAVGRASARRSVSDVDVQKGLTKWRPLVRNAAPAVRVDQILALSLIIVEDLQRPLWFRGLERRLARIGMAETVGVGQSLSKSGASDECSIIAAIRPLSGIVPEAISYPLRHDIISARLERHNSGKEFLSAFWGVYHILDREFTRSKDIAADGSPSVMVPRRERIGDFWIIRGEAHQSVRLIEVVLEMNDGGPWYRQTVELPEHSDGSRRDWVAKVPLADASVKLQIFYRDVQSPEVMFAG